MIADFYLVINKPARPYAKPSFAIVKRKPTAKAGAGKITIRVKVEVPDEAFRDAPVPTVSAVIPTGAVRPAADRTPVKIDIFDDDDKLIATGGVAGGLLTQRSAP